MKVCSRTKSICSISPSRDAGAFSLMHGRSLPRYWYQKVALLRQVLHFRRSHLSTSRCAAVAPSEPRAAQPLFLGQRFAERTKERQRESGSKAHVGKQVIVCGTFLLCRSKSTCWIEFAFIDTYFLYFAWLSLWNIRHLAARKPLVSSKELIREKLGGGWRGRKKKEHILLLKITV